MQKLMQKTAVKMCQIVKSLWNQLASPIVAGRAPDPQKKRGALFSAEKVDVISGTPSAPSKRLLRRFPVLGSKKAAK